MRTKIRKRPNGRWYVYVLQDGKEKGRGGFRTQREAKTAAKAIEVDSSRGNYVDPSRMTLGQGYAEWAATRKNLSPNSRAVEGVIWSSWILPVVGNVRVQRFTQRDYHRMDNALIARGLSGKSRRNARATLRTFFSWALDNGYVLRNVVALTDPPGTKDSKGREVFTAEEVRALLAVPGRLQPIWRLFLETGGRRGEVAGLRDEDVDGCNITIRRQALVLPSRSWDQERHYIRSTTKSRRERTVVVSEEMGVLLRRWKAQRAAEKLAFGAAYVDEAGSAPNRTARASPRRRCSARFKALERDAGVPHRGLHACRHTRAEMRLKAGVRLDVVSKQLGHASVAITADVYGHPDEEALKEAAEQLGSLLATGGMADGD